MWYRIGNLISLLYIYSYTEVAVITAHYQDLMDTISSDLAYFRGQFIEKAFLTSEVAHEIRSQSGVGDGEQVQQLLEILLKNLKTSPDKVTWLLDFIDVFSTEAAYSSLANKMLLAYRKGNYAMCLLKKQWHNMLFLSQTLQLEGITHGLLNKVSSIHDRELHV